MWVQEDPRMGTGSMQQRHASARRGSGIYIVALALALVVLCTAGCGQQTSVRSSVPTLTPTPMPRLAFRPVALPPGFKVPSGSPGVSPVDGKDAWACVDSGNGSFRVWATTDEGATWHTAGLLHPRTPMQPGSCGMLADQHDTKAAVFGVTWGAGEAGTLASMSYY